MLNSLKINQKAPNFTVIDVMGKKFSLSDLKSGYILLNFLRYAGCPWCNLAVHRLSIEYNSLKRDNCEVIAFIQSDKDKIVQNIYNRHKIRPPFSIIADPDRKIYSDYGVIPSLKESFKSISQIPYWVHAVKEHGFKQQKVDGNFFLVPAWFLIHAESKKIIKAEYNASFYDHDSFLHIYDSLTFKDT